MTGRADRPASYRLADDPVADVPDSLPVRPDIHRNRGQEAWQEIIEHRRKRKNPPAPAPEKRPPPAPPHVDEYASP